MRIINAVRSGIILAWRHKIAAAGIALMISVICVVLVVALADVITQTSVIIGAKKLRENNAVTFTPYYLESNTTRPSAEFVGELGRKIDNGAAYTMVSSNVRINDPSFANGNRAIILIGSSAQMAITGTSLCSPAPCAMAGERIPNPIQNSLKIGDENITVSKTIPSSAALFDPAATGVDLGKSVLIVLPPSKLDILDEYEQEEAVWRTVLFSPTDDETEKFATAAKDNHLLLVPHNLATDQPERYRELTVRAGLYGLSLMAVSLVVLNAYQTAVRSIIRREKSALILHHLYGATHTDLNLRVLVFLAFTILALPTFSLVVLSVMGPPFNSTALIVEVALFSIYVITSLQATREVSRVFSSNNRRAL